MIRINFSGHPITGFSIAPLVGANLPVTDGARLAAYLREILLALPEREDLLRGAGAEIILPGMTCAAGILLAEWHGQFGSFPVIRWAVTGNDRSFSWPEATVMDLQGVRNSARTAR